MRLLFHLLSPPTARSARFRTLIVLFSVAVSLAVRHNLHPWLGTHAPYAMLLPAVMASAWIGGCHAGLFATLLGGLVASWLFVEPTHSLRFDTPGALIVALLFAFEGVMISVLCGVIHQMFAAWQMATRQAAEDFENMADHAPGFVWSTTGDGSPGFVNQRWLTFTGTDPRSPEVDRLEHVHPADAGRVRAVMAEARQTRAPYQVEYRLRRADGAYRWIMEHAVPRFDAEGGFEGFIGSGADITPAHQEREELRFIGELHRSLATSLDLDKTADALVQAIVPALADWCGIQMLDERDGRLVQLRIHHADPEKVRLLCAAAPPGTLLGSRPEGGAARILREGEPRLVSAVDEAFLRAAAADDAELALLRSLGLASCLGVPLRVRGRIVGVLSLATAESQRTLGHDTLQLAVKIGGIAAFALENARLYQSVRRSLAAEEQARREREHSERRFRSAWEADIFGICIIERDGRVRAGNDAFLRLCGYSREDLDSGSVNLRAHIGDREAKFGTFIWEHMPEAGRCEPFEKVCIRRDGRRVPLLVGGSIQPDGESCLVFLLDLTARKAAETELVRQRELLKTIIDSVPAMVAYIAPDERFVLHNRQYERWLGVGHDDIHGKTLRELMGGAHYPDAEPHLQAALAGNKVRYETTIAAPHKSRDAMVSYRPDIDAAGRVVGVVIHAYDITESRQLALAVARSEIRYRTLITASAAIVWTADADGAIKEAAGWEAFTGRQAGVDVRALWLELVHPDDRDRVDQDWRRACLGGRRWDCVYRLLARDGRHRHVHSRAEAIPGPEGRVEEWIGAVTDITPQVEAEQSLRRKEAELKLLVDTMPALVAYVDKDGRYGLVNQTYRKWFGLDPEAMRGRLVSEVLGGETYSLIEERMRRVLAGEPVNYEEFLPQLHGEPRWISATLTPHVLENGEVGGFFALAIDISARKRVERELAELLERYRFLADAMPQNVWTTNAAGRQDYVNRRWIEYTGIGFDDDARDRWAEIVHPDDLEATRERWAQAVRDGRRYEMEHRLRDASGNYRWFLSLALARRDETGRVVQWVGTATDIDAQRRAYAELSEARAELKRHADNLENEVRLRTARLEEVNGELEAFTYSASHDLRVPLNHIHGFAEAVMEDRETHMSPDGQSNMRRILSSARRMDTLIQDLLAYSRMSRDEIVIKPTDLGLALDEVLAGLQATIRAGNAKIHMELPLPLVPADPVGLRQVLSNLLTNALKFTEPGRPAEVRIRAEARDGRTRLWVEDKGIGIDRRHHESVFKLFHRLHGAQAYAGTGIGLSLVKKGMARMGGDCGVESEPGAGSRFWLDFPPEAGSETQDNSLGSVP